MSLNAKSKRKKVTPAVHSVLDVLVGHIHTKPAFSGFASTMFQMASLT